MFRHYLIAALRNMAANKLQSLIAIFSLSLGLAAAILASLVTINQASFDHFLPDHDRIYLAGIEATMGGRPTDYLPGTPHDLAARLKQEFPEIQYAARITDKPHSLRRGDIEAQETIYSADPGIFQILRLPTLYGDLGTALDRPDAIVIPLSIARKYFGQDNVVGQTLELDRLHPAKVTAVVADLPANATGLTTAVFTSGRGADSDLANADKNPVNGASHFGLDVRTFVKLKRGASVAALQSRILAMSGSLLPRPGVISANLRLIRLDAYHLSPQFSPGVRDSLAIFSVVALLILFLSSVNFVNLATARATRRGIEVGIRKATGAGRPALVAQFLAESVLQALFALCLALAVVEWSLPVANAFLNSGAVFAYWRNPALDMALFLGAGLVGILAGIYPALVMSSFRPAKVLKGLMSGSPWAGLVRQSLVTAQFSILLLLGIATGVVLQQHRFAIAQAMRLPTDQVLFVRLPKCESAFKTEVAALPGVRGVACSNLGFIQEAAFALLKHPDGTSTALYLAAADPQLLAFYGERPIAGRNLRPTDLVNDDHYEKPINTVVNETAVRKLGLASPLAAIGHVTAPVGVDVPAIIVGVVPDFSFFALEKPINATAYYYGVRTGPAKELLHIRLKRENIPETLAAIDAAWNRSETASPIDRTFMDSYIENLHIGLLREGEAFLIFAGIAMLLGCLGLFGLSLSATERRTKEIGIRKALGATTGQVMRLLLWQFAKPVFFANLVTWPLAWWGMRRWLSSFAYHVDLGIGPFLAAGTVAVAIAVVTVSGHVLLVARQKPVLALRYE